MSGDASGQIIFWNSTGSQVKRFSYFTSAINNIVSYLKPDSKEKHLV